MAVEISVVVPVYNEEDNLRPLFDRLCATMDKMGRPWEVIFVNDGSSDKSGEILRGFCAERPGVARLVVGVLGRGETLLRGRSDAKSLGRRYRGGARRGKSTNFLHNFVQL